MIDAGPDGGKGAMLRGDSEEGLAFDVGVGYIVGVKQGGMVVERAEEIVVGVYEVVFA